MNLLLNIGLFKIGWLACVMGAANNIALQGCLLALFIAAISIRQSANSRVEILFVAIVTLIGLLWETLVVSQQWMIYASHAVAPDRGVTLAPYWLVVMWLLFATTINHSLSWLVHKPLIAMVMGAVFGPMAFIAGEKLGAVVFVNQVAAMLALAVGWAILMPLVCAIAKVINTKFAVANSLGN